MKKQNAPYMIKSISELHRLFGLPKPLHPLVSLFKFKDVTFAPEFLANQFMIGFYCVAIKKDFPDKLRYGQNYYDFEDGILAFISPNQLLTHIPTEMSYSLVDCNCLIFHPQFLSGYELGRRIREYGFFSYAANEALHLSDHEVITIEDVMRNIEKEYHLNIDNFSQDVMVAQIDLLLQYSNRFFNRQFITRKHASHDILIRMEKILNDYFSNESPEGGLLTVQFLSDRLQISPNYLSDMLRNLTGQTTIQHIQGKMIDKAKELLSTTRLSVNEIAYRLGFEYPQSFHKLFKKKTTLSPTLYRQSCN